MIAGNWKMNPAPVGAFDQGSPYHTRSDMDIVIFPTLLDLPAAVEAKLLCGPQCGHAEETGAHTGDISMSMLASTGAAYVLCGHSERRADHGETNEQVAAQVISALEYNLHPIICVGETEAQREAGNAEVTTKQQLDALLSHPKFSTFHSPFSIAYEPVWAIGTGNTATPQQAQEMHAYIRSLLPDDTKETIRILYGGSMKPANAKELLSQVDIDGGLIGGASLQPDQFAEIITIAEELSS